MMNPEGVLQYVGKAANLRRRLLSYFRKRGRPARAQRIIREARTVIWEHADSEFGALVRELELIQRWRPRWNVHGQPLRHSRTFVCLAGAEAPYWFLSRRPSRRARQWFGPIFMRPQARAAVRHLNDFFQLAECPRPRPMAFSDRPPLLSMDMAEACIRVELGACLGPCVRMCDAPSYHDQVDKAISFMRGTDLSPLALLQSEMLRAAQSRQFEKAASLRDRLAALEWLAKHLARLREARSDLSFVYCPTRPSGSAYWYLLLEGRVEARVAAPVDPVSRNRAAAAIRAIYEQARPAPRCGEAVDNVLLVSSWFRRFPEERRRTLSPRDALEACAAKRLASA
jgi:excinuclease ABC subunit C